MFTGRIQEIGEIESVPGGRIVLRAAKIAGRVQVGGSLNVAGVCVTVEHVAGATVTATVSAETCRRTTFDSCQPGQRVNLEPALAIGDPLDGHLVQGHVQRGRQDRRDRWSRCGPHRGAVLGGGLPPVGVCCEVMNPDGSMAGPADLEAAALRWGLPLVDVGDLRAWL